MKEKIKKPKRAPNRKPPEIIAKFEPSPYFEDEFLEFVETVLSWPEPEKEKTQNKEINDQK